MAGGAKFIPGHKSMYRNQWKSAIEEVRAVLAKEQYGLFNYIGARVPAICDEFVNDYNTTEGVVPVDTANLLDSFGVAVFKNDTLNHLSVNPAIATKRQRSGIPSLEGEMSGRSYMVNGRNELELLVDDTNIALRESMPATDYRPATLEGKVTAIMYLAAPYARAVHGANGEYYEAMENAFARYVVEPMLEPQFISEHFA